MAGSQRALGADKEGFAAELFREERARLARAFPGGRRHELDQAAAVLAFLRRLEELPGIGSRAAGAPPLGAEP